MNDEYDHDNVNLFYVGENIPGPKDNSIEYVKLLNDYNSEFENHCNCEDVCTYPKCNCLQLSGGNNYMINHHNDKLPILDFAKKVHSPILECNKLCSCSYQCGNRLVQLGPLKGLLVKKCDTQEKGFGLFTSVFINAGSFICQYAGELLTRNQAVEGYRKNLIKGEMNYIFCLSEQCGDDIIETFVDPSRFGNIGRYINHSCEPNSVIVPVRYDMPIPKLAIFSCVDIQPGSEITYNYSSNTKIKSSAEMQRKICLCKSKICNGFMPFDEI